MNTRKSNPIPNCVVQPSTPPSQRGGKSAARRSLGGRFAGALLLVALAMMFWSAASARADISPPGCLGSGLGINLFASTPNAHVGDTITYTVVVLNGPFPNCDASSITAFIVTPDNVTNQIPLLHTNLVPGQSDTYTNAASYVVRAQDIQPNGTVKAQAFDIGTIHQNVNNSIGSGYQSVNTDVVTPCIRITATCAGGVGENGLITFNGMITNCGNVELVNVVVTNFVNGGLIEVLATNTLVVGATASFSGSYVPVDPCSPSTATFTVHASDAALNPAHLTQSASTTCSDTLTPGIHVTKACPVAAPAPGQPLVFTGSVSNTGNVTLTNVVVVDDQPAPGTQVFTKPTLIPGEVAPFSGSYAAPTNCSSTSTLTATATSRCGTPVTSTATATCPILTLPAIVVSATCPATNVAPGGSFVYGGTVQNVGDITLTNVVVVSDQPAANTVVFSTASLAPGASGTFTPSFTAPLDACAVTTGLRATGEDSCSAAVVTNLTSITCNLTTTPGIVVSLACPTTPVVTGASITYNGTVHNTGNITLNNVTVLDTQATANPIVLTVPTLAPNASATFAVTFTTPTNSCSVSSSVQAWGADKCNQVMVTNSASATCPLVTIPALVVSQDCPAVAPAPGAPLVYSGSVSNAGDITLTNIVVLNDRSGATPVLAVELLLPGEVTNFLGSYAVPTNTACSITSTLTATGDSICGGSPLTNAVTKTCPLISAPAIIVTLACPDTPVAAGSEITFSGTVRNAGDVTLNNVTVYDAQAVTNPIVLNVASLAPGASAAFTANVPTAANTCSIASTVTAWGTDACGSLSVTNTAGTSCQLLTVPGISVTQTCPAVAPRYGAQIIYSGVVNNTGNVTLNNIEVFNDQSGTAPVLTVASLAPGQSTNYTAVGTAPLSGCSVTAIATAIGSSACTGANVTNAVSTTCPVATAPAIAVSIGCPTTGVVAGETITFSGSVHNTGDVPLNNVTVYDGQATPNTVVLSVPTLAAGASAAFTASFTSPANTCSVGTAVTAWGSDACNQVMVTNTASATCALGSTPAIAVTQSCPTALASAGGVLAYTGFVTNVGTITLTNVQVFNDRTGTNAVLVVESLAPNQHTNFAGTYTVPLGDSCDVTSVATAIGQDTCSGAPITNTFVSTCNLATTPAISVALSCPLDPIGPAGVVNYSGIVSNAGNVTLTNVTVVNNRPVAGTVVASQLTLAPGATAVFQGSYQAPSNCCVVWSTATATGQALCSGVPVQDSITTSCPVRTAPLLAVTKQCPAEPVIPGQTIRISGTVSNAGNITLVNVALTVTPGAPPLGGARAAMAQVVIVTNRSPVVGWPITLVPGESVDYVASYTVSESYCGLDTVTATGNDACNNAPVKAVVSTACPITTAPAIAVLRSCPAQPTPKGGTYTFAGTVTNTGNVTLENVFVFNDQPTNNTPVIGPITLAPGGHQDFTGSYTAPSCCCVIVDTLTVLGQDHCSGNYVYNTASSVCPLATAPGITVTLACPSGTISAGQTFAYTGTVKNTGDLNLTNVFVAASEPAANTLLLGPIELAPLQTEEFSGSFVVGSGGAAVTVSARGTDVCRGRTVNSQANCGGTITPTNSFTLIPGTFTGLFYNTNGLQIPNAGYFTFKVNPSGKYSASIIAAGTKFSASGTLSTYGRATNTIHRNASLGGDITVIWDAALNPPNVMSGIVSSGEDVALLQGDRAAYNSKTNPAPVAKYTVAFASVDSTTSPAGDGYGTVSVDANGKLKLSGKLADGTSVSQSSLLAPNGNWPLYASLYSKKGTLLGWMQFANRVDDDVAGGLVWIKPAITGTKYYPAGFDVDVSAIGSKFVKPVSPANVMNFTNGVVQLLHGNLAATYNNPVTFGPNSKVTNKGANKFSMSFSTSSGVFSGSFTDPSTGKTVSLKGVALQKTDTARGYHLGSSLSGQVLFIGD